MGEKVVITGCAGLVGHNLVAILKDMGFSDIVGIDKHPTNTAVLSRVHPEIEVIQADLARDDGWQKALQGADLLVMLHAQIGGLDYQEFVANNITATERVLNAAKNAGIGFMVHASSSVVNSKASDYYTETKKAQEKIVLDSGIPCTVLRPTLMFGWFDRKHLGWLARFMAKVPVFPIPGHGGYMRQPLFAGDFCAIIAAALRQRIVGVYDISGQEKVDYIDLIRTIKDVTRSRTWILRIPYWSFHALLTVYALIDRDPPFTTKQLQALVTPDEFAVIDWPGLFGVQATPLRAALDITFNDPRYADIALDF